MKPKKLNKKLSFTKTTIADLSGGEMRNLNGGEDAPVPNCKLTILNSGCETAITLVCSAINCC
jgi:natural product precursor